MIIWDKAGVIKVSDNALEHLEVRRGDKGCRYCTKMLRWGKKRHSAFAQLLSVNISTFCYTVTLEEIGMMISKIDSDGNTHIDLNALPRLKEVVEQLLAYVALAIWGWRGKGRKLLLFRRHLTNAIAMTTIKCQGLI